jgi:hypothetical protein
MSAKEVAKVSDLPSYEDVLELLSERAREGSVSAMIALERACARAVPTTTATLRRS